MARLSRGQPYRILVLAGQLLASSIASGGDRLFGEIAIEWQKKGHKVTLLLPSFARAAYQQTFGFQNFIELSVDIRDRIDQSAIRLWQVLALYLRRARDIKALIGKEEFDLIYTSGDFLCNTLPAVDYLNHHPKAKWFANIFHINEVPWRRRSNWWLIALGSYLIQRWSFFLINRLAHKIFLLNRGTEKELAEMGFNRSKLAVVGGGLRFLPLSRKKPADIALFIGRLNKTKGVFDLPRIWRRVLERAPMATLILVGRGDPQVEQDLKRAFARAGLSQSVNFYGFVDDDRLIGLMRQAKVFILPSYEEGWSIATYEAIAAGAAPALYRLPIFREVLGLADLPAPGEIRKMADRVAYFLTDERTRRNFVLALRRRVRPYSWSRLAAAELAFLDPENRPFKSSRRKKSPKDPSRSLEPRRRTVAVLK